MNRRYDFDREERLYQPPHGPWWWRYYPRPECSWETWHPATHYIVILGISAWFTPALTLIWELS